MKKSEELKAKLDELKDESKKLVEDENASADVINAKAAEIKTLKAKIALQEQDEEDERKSFQNKFENTKEGVNKMNKLNISDILNKIEAKEELTSEETKAFNKLHLKAFSKAIARKNLSNDEIKALSSNTDADGGYLIPQDIQTRINELQRQYASLRTLVNIEPVTTNSGTRIVEAAAERNAFGDIAELTNIPNTNSPQFAKIDYKIRDLGGLLPIPNDLLDDNTAGLTNYLANWFVKKQYATDNAIILYADGTKGSQGIIALAGTDDSKYCAKKVIDGGLDYTKAKKFINKDLDPVIASNAVLVTNQDGLDQLDMVDANGRPLLTGDGTQATPYIFKGKVVKVYSNDIINNVTVDTKTYAPILYGDLKQLYTLFDRQQMAVATSKEAGFVNNSTIMRAIVREDGRLNDRKAGEVILVEIV